MKIRWKRWALGGAGLLAVYTAVGFGLVPWVIRNQVPKIAQEELARKGEIGEVKFNPFTLRLEAKDIRLSEADGAPLFGVGSLAVDMDWNSLVRRAWSFAEIRIGAPTANLAIAPDGKFNLAELLATIDRKPRKPSTSTGLPRLIVEKFAIEAGKVEMRDRQAGYVNTFTPIDFSLQNFSTLPDHKGPYTFAADSSRGGKIRWKGEASVNPIRGSGEVVLESASLPELAVYLKPYARVGLAAGRLGATFPYQFAYGGGKLTASVNGARVALSELALVHEGGKDSFATLSNLSVTGINADLASRAVTVDELKAAGGKLAVKRDPKGELDLAGMLVDTPARPASGGAVVVVANWKLGVKQVSFEDVAVSAVDETVSPALNVSAARLQLRLKLDAEQSGALTSLKVSDGQFAMSELAVSSGNQAPVKIAQLGFADGEADVAARRASVGRLYAEGGQLKLSLDKQGRLNLLGLLPKPMVSKSAEPAPGPAWVAVAKSVEVSKFAADFEDQGHGLNLHAQDINAKIEGAGSDLALPVKFTAALSLREGGQLSAQGRAVPATGAVEADVRVRQLALAPVQPLLARYVKLKLAGGSVSTQGRLTTGAKDGAIRYVGGFDVAGLVLNELDNELFASWKNVGAEKFSLSLSPNKLDVPELRIVEPNAKLIIENDRSFNALRLLVQPATGGAQVEVKPVANPVAQGAAPATDPFPVSIRRVRIENAKLDFTDLSLRPQFGAKINEMNGVITGLSSNRSTRSQIELDGRVDEFGLARIRGELNPFSPRDNTDVSVIFKNVDMVTASPYSMKFAGYKIAEGKISLDLNYKVRNNQLEGQNQIVIDKLTLGERVDSPDALKLPLELAIAILKDSDGRIDLGLPVSGNMNDPQFSYGSVIWKAIGNVLTRIVTAPFRALGALFGGSGEKLESIDFDPGSDKLLPPEREKIKQITQLLVKRPQLKLAVPGQYSEAADGAALKARLVRNEIAKRAGIKLAVGEEPGPMDIRDRAVRGALRDLYGERFGAPELDKAKAEAEKGSPAPAPKAGDDKAADAKAPDAKPADAKPGDDKLPIWQRMGKLIQGEPQVADATAFYRKLQERLNASQPLAADALSQLGTQRANAIVAALQEGGVDAGRAATAPPEKVDAAVGKPVPLKLGLAAK
jgi:hypothetical protein